METSVATISGDDLPAVNQALAGRTAEERVGWAVERFGERLILSTSFGAQAAVMLHLVTRQVPSIPVVFVDTGYLFPETYRFAAELTERLGLNLQIYVPRQTAAHQEAIHGKLWEQGREGLTRYGLINKVEPMNRAVRELGAEAWLAGLRRQQARTRAELAVVTRQNRIHKVHPILDWSDRDIYQYLQRHDLPYHPLWHRGYVSIGDWHSTRPLGEGMTEEETRFQGLKRECGLHESSGQADFQI